MSRVPRMNRRAFLASAAAAGGALALGFDIPLGPRTIRASESVSEITVKVNRAQLMRKMNAKSVADLIKMEDRLSVKESLSLHPLEHVAECMAPSRM